MEKNRELGPFAVLVNNGYRYEYYTTVQARTAREARQIFNATKDWRTESFKVRDDRSTNRS